MMALLTSPIAVGDKFIVGETVRTVTAMGAATLDASGSNNTYLITMGSNSITVVASSIVLQDDMFDGSKGNVYVFSGTARVPFSG